MSTEPLTSHEYWQQVSSLVDNLLEEARDDGLDREDLDQRLWETIDGHEWVIYTGYHYEVLGHSDNDGYTVEQFGAESAVSDGQLNTAALAFGALYGDVSERLWQRVEDCPGCEGCDNNLDPADSPETDLCAGLGWYDNEREAA